MNRLIAAALALALTLPVLAQAGSKSESPAVASVNGEVITKARLNEIWDRVPPHLQRQYASVGGKKALLDNYIRKRLLLQHAAKTGFVKTSERELDVAAESQAFDRYVREVIAPTVVSEAKLREFYEENRVQFRHPPQARLRHIFVSSSERPEAEARERLAVAMNELHEYRTTIASEPNRAELLRDKFSEVARRHSEEEATAANGGLVGWVGYENLSESLAEAARTLGVGSVSGMLTSDKGFHLLFVEDRRGAGVEPFEAVAGDIREYLHPRYMNQIIEAVNQRTAELLESGDVKVYAEHLD